MLRRRRCHRSGEVLIVRLEAGGAERGTGAVVNGEKIAGWKMSQVECVGVRKALHAGAGTVDLTNAWLVLGFGDDGGEAGVEDGGGAAALDDHQVACGQGVFLGHWQG